MIRYLIRDRALDVAVHWSEELVGRLAEVVELENGLVAVAWLPSSTGRLPEVEVCRSLSEVSVRFAAGEAWLEDAVVPKGDYAPAV